MMFMFQDEMAPLIGNLIETYGLTGLAFGLLLTLMLRQSKGYEKRIADLETYQKEQYETNAETHKSMVLDYTTLVQNTTKVLSDLTGCLKAIKDTLERLERK